MVTTYDKMRHSFKEKLHETEEACRELIDRDTWGYEEMRENYIHDVYKWHRKLTELIEMVEGD